MSEVAKFKITDYPVKQIGTSHWYRTLITKAKHCAEFISNHPEHENVQMYANTIKDVMDDLILAQELGVIETLSSQEPLSVGETWWESQNVNIQLSLCFKHFGHYFYNKLKKSHIEYIWETVTQKGK